MGIYDRDYYRREGGGFLASLGGRHQVCTWLISVNVVVFVIQLITLGKFGSPGWFTETFWLRSDKVLDGEVWRLLTSAFLHSPMDFWHIVFNMLFLWFFGFDVEDIYGSKEFLGFYLTAALAGSLAFVASAYGGLTGLTPKVPALGASGAVTAVMIVCACHYPYRTILLFGILPMPIWLLVGLQIAKDFFGLMGAAAAGTAFAAHLGGAAFGFLYFRYQWRVTAWLPRVNYPNRDDRPARPALRVYRDDETASTQPAPAAAASVTALADLDEHLEAKLDQVLEKVQQHGRDSLTEGERQVLLRASEIYRKRRQ